ncbi:hypothetical protein J6590_106264 [Homalodisca vitripennis]|nr:hypothetical protein J6590_106264 [Homalodisca vitripennis]
MKIRLSEAQKRKLRAAYKRRKSTVIRLSNEQLSHGSDRILLSGEQHKDVSRAVKNKKGLQLLLSYNQLVSYKQGGVLKEIMEMVDSSVPGVKRFISPLSLVDEELDTIIEKDPTGRGLKRRIGRKLDALLSVNKKKRSSRCLLGFDDPPICGHLCLEVLQRDSAGEDWEHILGFEKSDATNLRKESSYFNSNENVIASNPPNLKAVDVIEIHCNIVNNSLVNHDVHSHKHLETAILYTSSPNVPHGYKISQSPQEKHYIPLRSGLRKIQQITITLVDQNNQLLQNSNVNNIVYLDLISKSQTHTYSQLW